MKVYLVDDDAEEADLFREAISGIDQRIEIVWCDNVMEALDELIAERRQPDFLFLDLNIPKISGKEMLKLLRQQKATLELPVIIYSTSISKKDIDDTSPYNVRSYLQKPDDFQILCTRLREVITEPNGLSG